MFDNCKRKFFKNFVRQIFTIWQSLTSASCNGNKCCNANIATFSPQEAVSDFLNRKTFSAAIRSCTGSVDFAGRRNDVVHSVICEGDVTKFKLSKSFLWRNILNIIWGVTPICSTPKNFVIFFFIENYKTFFNQSVYRLTERSLLEKFFLLKNIAVLVANGRQWNNISLYTVCYDHYCS